MQSPDVAMRDGAPAIHNAVSAQFDTEDRKVKQLMCWAHVVMNCDKRKEYRSLTKKQKEEIRSAYFAIQCSPSDSRLVHCSS